MERKCANCCWWSANTYKPEEATGEYPCWHPAVGGDKGGEHGTDCDYFLGSDSTEANVPDHLRGATMYDANPNPVGPTEVLVISCAKDFEWLVWCLRCARKFLSGFQGVTVTHPIQDAERFRPLLDQFDVRLYAHEEIPGKGMLNHFALMASADQFLPSSTQYILTLDSDCMFKMPSRPENFFYNDKPYWIARTWESLTTEDPRVPGGKVTSDCIIWREPTDAQLGFKSDLYTMCSNTQAIPVDILPHYRNHLQSVHGKPFVQYMLEGRNEFPQTRVDFNAIGAFAYRHFRDRFHWFNTEAPPFPGDRKKAFHSHSGLRQDIIAEIESFLA